MIALASFVSVIVTYAIVNLVAGSFDKNVDSSEKVVFINVAREI